MVTVAKVTFPSKRLPNFCRTSSKKVITSKILTTTITTSSNSRKQSRQTMSLRIRCNYWRKGHYGNSNRPRRILSRPRDYRILKTSCNFRSNRRRASVTRCRSHLLFLIHCHLHWKSSNHAWLARQSAIRFDRKRSYLQDFTWHLRDNRVNHANPQPRPNTEPIMRQFNRKMNSTCQNLTKINYSSND